MQRTKKHICAPSWTHLNGTTTPFFFETNRTCISRLKRIVPGFAGLHFLLLLPLSSPSMFCFFVFFVVFVSIAWTFDVLGVDRSSQWHAMMHATQVLKCRCKE